MMKPAQVVKALAALAQTTRLSIYRLLVKAGPEGKVAGQIADRLKMSPAAMSFHFRILVHAGLIQKKQEGRFVYYTANFTAMNDMIDYLTENCCGGDDALCMTTKAKKSN